MTMGSFNLHEQKSPQCINEPRHKKTCVSGFRPGKTQIGLLSYRD